MALARGNSCMVRRSEGISNNRKCGMLSRVQFLLKLSRSSPLPFHRWVEPGCIVMRQTRSLGSQPNQRVAYQLTIVGKLRWNANEISTNRYTATASTESYTDVEHTEWLTRREYRMSIYIYIYNILCISVVVYIKSILIFVFFNVQ